MVQVFGPLPPSWETQMELLLPGYSLSQHWLLWPSVEWTSWQVISLLVVYAWNNKVNLLKKIDCSGRNRNTKLEKWSYSNRCQKNVSLFILFSVWSYFQFHVKWCLLTGPCLRLHGFLNKIAVYMWCECEPILCHFSDIFVMLIQICMLIFSTICYFIFPRVCPAWLGWPRQPPGLGRSQEPEAPSGSPVRLAGPKYLSPYLLRAQVMSRDS